MTADRLIRLQRLAGLSNVELARLIGRNPSTIYRWRQGYLAVPVYVEVLLVRMVQSDARTSSRSLALRRAMI